MHFLMHFQFQIYQFHLSRSKMEVEGNEKSAEGTIAASSSTSAVDAAPVCTHRFEVKTW
jgi:hypothetical protein